LQRLSRTLESAGTSDHAQKEHNVAKNRSQAVVPYDYNRIVLAPVPGAGEITYINASLVKVSGRSGVGGTSALQGYFYPYILTQDPLSTTVFDFWRLVNEHAPSSIVMLSDESQMAADERVCRCTAQVVHIRFQYWPEHVGDCRTFGTGSSAVNVKLHAHDNHGVYQQRTLAYAKASETGEHEVVQFVFNQWPAAGDQPVPASAGALLDLIGRVLKRQTREQTTAGPIVVHCRYELIRRHTNAPHCSDGASRCGLYTVVSLLLERLKAENRVDVFQTVKTLQATRAHTAYNFVSDI
jgi:protein-tyrosine phosphatase